MRIRPGESLQPGEALSLTPHKAVKFNDQGNHGQRTLNSFDTKDLHQEAIIPATDSAFHGKAVFAGMLLEQR